MLINGQEKDVLIDIFITLFPFNGKSYLIMAYEKIFERDVKAYVNSYFAENEKRTERKLTNLLLFQCETWVCSESFYNTQIKPSENLFFEADNISFRNNNERRNYDLNIFRGDFKNKFYAWFKQNI